jgi:hypothetical protein
MGKGKVNKGKDLPQLARVGKARAKVTPPMPTPAVGSVIILPIQVNVGALTGVSGSTFGVPIMREGFVTDTGFLPLSK